MKERDHAQALALEAEQAKRGLSVRPRAALTVAAGGKRKTYQVELEQFERLTKELVDRMEALTLGLLKERNMGWAKVDVVLTTGGASRMPMVRTMLKRLSGRTLNTSLSPDQSIAHGATYYAGMLLTNSSFAKSILNPSAAARLAQFKQKSVNARALGVLVRDADMSRRVPHYILPANTPIPAAVSQTYGTIQPNQRRVRLRIVESGTTSDSSYVELGICQIEPLPENLPAESEIEVTIHYDAQGRVHVTAKVKKTGQEAQTEIIRPENLVVSALSESNDVDQDEAKVKSAPSMSSSDSAAGSAVAKPVKPNLAARVVSKPKAPSAVKPMPVKSEASAAPIRPIPICDQCGDPLDLDGICVSCSSASSKRTTQPKPIPLSPKQSDSSEHSKSSDFDDSEFWRSLGQ